MEGLTGKQAECFALEQATPESKNARAIPKELRLQEQMGHGAVRYGKHIPIQQRELVLSSLKP